MQRHRAYIPEMKITIISICSKVNETSKRLVICKLLIVTFTSKTLLMRFVKYDGFICPLDLDDAYVQKSVVLYF